MEASQMQEAVPRRKGQPRKPDIEPLYKKVLRCANGWMALCGILIFLSMLWIWAMHNIHLVVGSMQTMTALAAEMTDKEAAADVAERLLRIRADAPQGATGDYTADEQVVLLARYHTVEEEAAWQDLHAQMKKISESSTFSGEFSLVCLDAKADQLIWIASAGHPAGYSAWMRDLAVPDEDGYELKSIRGHTEGTAVLSPLGIAAEGCDLYICGAFSFAGIMAQESDKLLVPVGILLAGMVIVSIRLLIILWKKRMQEEAAEEEDEEEEDEAADDPEEEAADAGTEPDEEEAAEDAAVTDKNVSEEDRGKKE